MEEEDSFGYQRSRTPGNVGRAQRSASASRKKSKNSKKRADSQVQSEDEYNAHDGGMFIHPSHRGTNYQRKPKKKKKKKRPKVAAGFSDDEPQ